MFDYARHAARLAAIEERQDELLEALDALIGRVEATLVEARGCLEYSSGFFQSSQSVVSSGERSDEAVQDTSPPLKAAA